MGSDKHLLPFFRSTLGEHLVDELAKVCRDVRCTTKKADNLRMEGVPVHVDAYDTDSALTGIHAGLAHATTEWSFVIACDLPFFDHRVVEIMARQIRPGIDAVVPIKNGFWEPLCALYSRNCLAAVTGMLEAGEYEIKKLYSKIKVRSVAAEGIERQTHEHVFFNMNTREDYRRALELQKSLEK